MRAVMNGRYRLHEVTEEFTRLVENLEANGVEEIDSINLYFTPMATGRTMRFYNAHGDEIDIIRFRQAAPKDFVPLSDNITVESRVGATPKEAAARRRMMRGDVPASVTLDPTPEERMQAMAQGLDQQA